MATKVNRLGRNQVLSLLPAADRRRILDRSDRLFLDARTILYRADDLITHIYFPLGGMVSLVITTEEGETVEVGSIGNEGLVGTARALGAERSHVQALVQVSGEVLRMPLKDFQRELKRSAALARMTQRFAQALLTQIAQSVACNQLHSVEQRTCRWFLMTHDRAGVDEMVLTQQFVSQMLGVRRPSVTVAAGILQKAGLIRYARGKLTVLDRKGLEAGACECYGIVKRESERLLAA